MHTTAVIIAPTRELAHQITDAAKSLLVNTKYGAQVLTSGMAARDISATLRKRCGQSVAVFVLISILMMAFVGGRYSRVHAGPHDGGDAVLGRV